MSPSASAPATPRAGPWAAAGRLLPVAALIAPLLPALAAPLWLALVAVLWVRSRPEPLELRVVGSLLVVALVALLLPLVAARGADRPDIEARLGRGFEGLWQELEEIGEVAAARLEAASADPSARLDQFAELQRVAERGGRATLQLLDGQGRALAWAGEGLLHDIGRLEPPEHGRGYRAGFNAVTLLVTRAVGAEDRSWRLVVGRSFATDRLPWREAAFEVRRWTIASTDRPAAPGVLRINGEGGPDLLVAGEVGRQSLRETAAGRSAGSLLALGVIVSGVLGLVGGERSRRRRLAALVLLAGLAALLGTLRVDALAGGLLVAAAAALLLVVLVPSVRRVGAAPAGVLAALLWGSIGVWLHGARHPVDLGATLFGSLDSVVLGVAGVLATLAVLATAFGGEARPGRDRRAWAALLTLLVGGLFLDRPWLGFPLLIAGSICAAAWARRSPWPGKMAPATVLLVLASLISAEGWELSYRAFLKRHLEIHALHDVAPPDPVDLDERARALQAHFRGFDLASVSLSEPEPLEDQDLAYAVWRASPLAMRGALSALVVETGTGRRSTFSFGLPVDEEGEIDRSPARWRQIGTAFREARFVEGEAELLLDDRPWGVVRYWLFLQPGARGGPIEDLIAGLLRGEPIGLGPADGVLGTIPFVLYSSTGQILSTPWAETPSANAVRAAGPGGLVGTPDGRSLVFKLEAEEGLRVLFLRLLTPWRSLERVVTHAMGPLLIVALAILVSFLLRVRFEAVRRTFSLAFRSYSRRLLIVSTAFVVVPLLVVSILLVGVLGRRLERGQQADGRAALESAQRILGEYVLTLEPGFGIETALGDEILIWVSRVVHHEVNLYWGGSVYATSKRALFAAGLLPARIPGEIYSRLTLDGAELASRVNRAGATAYLELYAPVRVPGVPVGSVGLYASMPLLAQEEEVEGELAALRRRAVIFTTALTLLLATLGSRIARRFTTPLMELVEGTQRIAAGATSLGIKPAELELATLAEAIDRMAVKIDEGRQTLVQERDVLDRMIDNITSGVISLDREGRVALANQVAKERFGVEVGQQLEAALGGEEQFATVLEFVREDHAQTEARTVRLESGEEELEWSLVWVPLPGPGEPAALLVVEDVTEVLRAQRLEAWAEMARIIAHEIKNPLTPIRLSAEHMRQVRDSDPDHFEAVFERCTANILEQVRELQEISTEFSAYSRLPEIDRQPGDLVELVGRIVEAYRSAPVAGVGLELDTELAELPLVFDAKLVGRALRNLIENAVRATGSGGTVTIRLRLEDGGAWVHVLDDGPGVDAEQLSRIFDPYFSTHDAGTGLGLPIARRIVEEHGGRIEARNRTEGGLEVGFLLPVA